MYNPYEPYRKLEDSQDSARGSFDRESGEYHYVRPESANRHYSDASYTPAESSPVRRYYYTPPEKRDRSKKGKEGRLTARIIALGLICALAEWPSICRQYGFAVWERILVRRHRTSRIQCKP